MFDATLRPKERRRRAVESEEYDSVASKFYYLRLDQFRMPAEPIELSTPNVHVAAARQRREAERLVASSERNDYIHVTPSNSLADMQTPSRVVASGDEAEADVEASTECEEVNIYNRINPSSLSGTSVVQNVEATEEEVDHSGVGSQASTSEVVTNLQSQQLANWDSGLQAVSRSIAWIERMAPYYRDYHQKYAEKYRQPVIEDVLSIHTQRNADKSGLGWQHGYEFMAYAVDIIDRVTSFVHANESSGVPVAEGRRAEPYRFTLPPEVERRIHTDERGRRLLSWLR